LVNCKEGCHSELVACPTHAERIFGEGNRFLVRCPVAELVEAYGGLRMAFLPNDHRRIFPISLFEDSNSLRKPQFDTKRISCLSEKVT